MTLMHDRRSLLRSGPAAAVALAVPASVSATAAVDRSAWEQAKLLNHALNAENAAFSARYEKAWKACSAECKEVPHVILEPSKHTGRWHVSTADDWYVRRCRSDVAALNEGRMRFDPLPHLLEHERQMRALVEAADARDAIIQSIRDRYGMDDLDDQSDDLGDRMADAQSTLMDLPAPDLSALRWKLDHLTEDAQGEDGSMACYGHSYVAQAMRDIARLLPEAA